MPHPRLRLRRCPRPNHFVPTRMVVVRELGLSVNGGAVAFDGERIGDVARVGRPGAGVLHNHVCANACAAVHQPGVQAGGEMGVHRVGGSVLEGGHHRVFRRHCASQAAAGAVGDLRFQLGLGLGNQVGCHIAIGIEHLGFEFQVPVGVGWQNAGCADCFRTCVEVDDARLARLHVGQLCAEHGEAGGAVAVGRDFVALQRDGDAIHFGDQALRGVLPVAGLEGLAEGDGHADLGG